MKKRLRKSMILIVFVTLIITCGCTTWVMYRQTMDVIRKDMAQEAAYIRRTVELFGTEHLQQMDRVERRTRVTLIDSDGTVQYDSQKSRVKENHAGRKEVVEAKAHGEGTDVRRSRSLGNEMMYYAVLLENGQILRVSKNMDTVLQTSLKILPAMGVVGVLMFLVAAALSQWQVKKLIRPINHMDLEHPLENQIYEELVPLLESLDRRNKEKEEAEKIRREFSANVSHELKTPLTSISGYAELMERGMVKKEDVERFSGRIYHEARRLITLIHDMMKLSHLDEGGSEMEKEPVDLMEIAKETAERLKPLADRKGITLEVLGETAAFTGIRMVLEEMLFNLCENAIKYNREGGRVTVLTGSSEEELFLQVKDTGIGIREEDQERVFERFYRVDKSRSKESGGTGLGLSIVKHGALVHEGRICLQSREGTGTRIRITFPKNK